MWNWLQKWGVPVALGTLLIPCTLQEASAQAISPLFTAGMIFEWDDAPPELFLPRAWGESLKVAHGPQWCLGFSAGSARLGPTSTTLLPSGRSLENPETNSQPTRPAFWATAPANSAGAVCAGAVVRVLMSPDEQDYPVPGLEWATLLSQLQRKDPPLALATEQGAALLMVPTQDFFILTDPTRWLRLAKVLAVIQAGVPFGTDRDSLIAAVLRPVGIALYRGEYPRLVKVQPISDYETAFFRYEDGVFKAKRTLANDVYALALLRAHAAQSANSSPFLEDLNASVKALKQLSNIEYLEALSLDRTHTPAATEPEGACVQRYSNSVAYAPHCHRVPGVGGNRASLQTSCLYATAKDPDIYWDLGESGQGGFLSISFGVPGQSACHMARFELADHGAPGLKIDEHVEDERQSIRQPGTASPPKLAAD